MIILQNKILYQVLKEFEKRFCIPNRNISNDIVYSVNDEDEEMEIISYEAIRQMVEDIDRLNPVKEL